MGAKNTISVIIPLYNTPIDFFERCLRSIDVSLKNIKAEVIVIDDGSKVENSDAYQNIVNKYKYGKYVYRENGGVSAARNQGIQIASGKYISFVDGDDEVSPNFFTNAYELALKFDVDVVIGQIEYIPTSMRHMYSLDYVYLDSNSIGYLKKAFFDINQNKIPYQVTGSPCGRLYKSGIIQKAEFPVGITHWEDQIFNRIVFEKCNSAVISGENWYIYYQNEFSAMHTNFDKNYIKNGLPFWELWDELNQQEKEAEIIARLNQMTLDYYYASIHQSLINLDKKWNEKKNIMRSLRNESIFSHLDKHGKFLDMRGWGNKLRFFLYKCNMYSLMYLFVKVKTLKG